MPVPSVITDLSTTAASNSPAGTDPPASTDDYLRAHASFIAQNYGNKLDKSGAVTPTANQPMGGYKHTGAGTATAAGNYVVWNQTGVKFPAMGIGTASSSWGGSGVYAVDIAARGAIYGNASSVSVAANTYYDGTNNRAKETAAGALLEVGAGTITAYTMASVSAGVTQNLTSRLQIKANGQTRFLPLSSDPSGAEAGDVYYSSTTGGLRYYSGNSASWEDVSVADEVTTVAAIYGDYVAPSEVAMLANFGAAPGTTCLRTDIESENGGTLFSLTELPADDIDSWERVGTLVPETATQTSTLTASGAARSGPGYLAGLHVTAYSGGPQTVTAYDSEGASGTVLKEWTVTGVGWYPYSTAGNSRAPFDVGVYMSISGGTSRTVAALIEALD